MKSGRALGIISANNCFLSPSPRFFLNARSSSFGPCHTWMLYFWFSFYFQCWGTKAGARTHPLGQRSICAVALCSLPVSHAFSCFKVHWSVLVTSAFIPVVFPTWDVELYSLGNPFRSFKISPSSHHAHTSFYLRCTRGLFIHVFKHFRLLICCLGCFWASSLWSILLIMIYGCLVKQNCTPSKNVHHGFYVTEHWVSFTIFLGACEMARGVKTVDSKPRGCGVWSQAQRALGAGGKHSTGQGSTPPPSHTLTFIWS